MSASPRLVEADIDPHDTIDQIVADLAAGEQRWATTSLAERRDLLLEVVRAVETNAAAWVEAAIAIKDLDPASPLVGEEWISGPYAVAASANALAVTLGRLAGGEDVLGGYHLSAAPGDRVAVQVMPHGTFDRLLLSGFRAEVWSEPGTTEADLHATAGLAQLDPTRTHGVAVVLGAGNILSIAPLDVLYQLFAENRTAVLKLNPVTDALRPVFEAVLAPLIANGFVTIVTGGIEVGTALIEHTGVSAVHMTGSEATHDAIVWGTGEAGRAARAAGQPRLAKPISSELGGSAPTIIVPGRWSRADLRFQAEHVATQRLHNSGSNCIASQVVIVSSDWAQKDEFLDALRAAMAGAPARPAWYPGSAERIATARAEHPDAEAIGGSAERTLLSIDLYDDAEPALATEFFAPVLAVAELPGEGEEFFRTAVEAANERLRGTLGANIVVHPRTRKRIGAAFDELVAQLRYGTIGINAWTGVGYLTARATWGAFPGHALDDIQSGTGVVHNALLLDRTERTVVTGPFRPLSRSILHGEMSISPRPPWFVTNRTAATTGRRLASFAARPRWRALPAIFASALRG